MHYIQGMPVSGISLRSLCAADAAETVAMMRQIYAETEFLSTLPEEYTETGAGEAALLTRMEASEREGLIGAWVDGRLAGSIRIACAGDRYRVKHRAVLGIAVRKEFWGRGVGSMLMDAALQTAAAAGYAQAELEVAGDNERAIRLYERFGFEIYGRRPMGMRRSRTGFVELVLMAKRLNG